MIWTVIGLSVLVVGLLVMLFFILRAQKGLMQDTFRGMAAQALEGNAKHFLELAKSVLEKESLLAKGDFEKRQISIQESLKPLKETLDRYQQQVAEIERERQKAYTSVEVEIKRLAESQVNLAQVTTALKDALKKPHIRGRWGEVQLRNCIELAGMSEYADVSFQAATTSDDQRLIPDMVVRMPGGRVVVVDAKTPLDAFISSLEATSHEARHTEMLRHGRHVKEHVKRLAVRAYADFVQNSADFTVMFLPNESFLYAALESENDLIEFALQKKILIATPPTLIGLLKVIRYGWNEQKLAENSQQISEAGQELHKRLVDFVETFTNIGTHLEKAKLEYDKGLSRLDSRVLVQARRLERLGAKSTKDLPAGLGESELV